MFINIFGTAYGNGSEANQNNSPIRYYSSNVSDVPVINITFPEN